MYIKDNSEILNASFDEQEDFDELLTKFDNTDFSIVDLDKLSDAINGDVMNGEENGLYERTCYERNELANDYLEAVEAVKRAEAQYHETICVRNGLFHRYQTRAMKCKFLSEILDRIDARYEELEK